MQNQWLYRPCITCHEYRLFYTAIGENKDFYMPDSIANQDDLRFRFICHTYVTSNVPTHYAIIEIYRPRSGTAYVTKILPINIDL
ncbi:MAG TPA: hypothetical protein VN131_06960 [Mobilitalea sp.]|nr:hypothetical protein [Mobilitalea sp.]